MDSRELVKCEKFYNKIIKHLLGCKKNRRILLDPELFKDFLINGFALRDENMLNYMTLKHYELIQRMDDYLLGLR